MKTNKIIAMSLLAALAVGCSSDDIVDDGGKGGNNTFTGTSFVGLNITLPSTNGSSRADVSNESYKPGDADEYKVNKVTVTYYSTESATSTILGTFDYEAGKFSVQAGTDDITQKVLLPVEKVNFQKAYALVEINKPSDSDMSVDENGIATTSAQAITGSGKSFYMTNTVMKDGTYLTQVTAYDTETEAINHAKEQNIYVERAAAKVEVNVGTGTGWGTDNAKTTYTIPETDAFGGSTVTIDNWVLDLTNTVMYPVRRFAGIGTEAGQFAEDVYTRFFDSNRSYRTFWAEDPNYSTAAKKDELTHVTDIKNDLGTIEYCLENTFNTEFQKQSQTTRVLIAATFKPAGVTFEENEKSWYTIGSSSKAYSGTELGEVIKIALGTDSDVELSDLVAGKNEVKAGTFKVGNLDCNDSQAKTVAEKLGGTITAYIDGKCYYVVRIKHLDEFCPWGERTTNGFKDYVNVEMTERDAMEKAYLGRYGVVRNNWYQVTINKVTQPGEPTVPEIPTGEGDTPDDVHSYYLQANINILDWAVRTQGVDL